MSQPIFYLFQNIQSGNSLLARPRTAIYIIAYSRRFDVMSRCRATSLLFSQDLVNAQCNLVLTGKLGHPDG